MASAPSPTVVSPERAAALHRELREALRGEVRFDRLNQALYATDASLYQIPPVGVALPADSADVVRIVSACAANEVPLVARGAGTGIAGGALGWGLAVDFSRHMNRILAVDPDARTVVVQPGCVLDDLNAALSAYELHFPPDVATASRATIGGMIANNSCGAHSIYYGRTVDYVEALTVVLADGSVENWRHHPFVELPPMDGIAPQRPFGLTGEGRPVGNRPHTGSDGRFHTGPVGNRPHTGGDDRFHTGPVGNRPHTVENRPHTVGNGAHVETGQYGAYRFDEPLDRIRRSIHDEVLTRYPRVLRRNGGYALDRLCFSERPNPATLICGSEGTLGLVVEARLRLAPIPRCRALVVLSFERLYDALEATPALLKHRPAALELVDDLILRAGAGETPVAARDAFLSGIPAAILVCELADDDADSLRGRIEDVLKHAQAERIGVAARAVFDPATQLAVWSLRNRGFGLLMSRPGKRHPHEFIEDTAVAPERLAAYIRELDTALAEEGVTEVAHYAHASVGVIHVRPTLNLSDSADRARLRRVAERTSDLALKYGGAMTGEHGDGIVRSEWLEKMYGARITDAFRAIKQLFDPRNLLNPRKIVDPLPMDERLRYAHSPSGLPLAPRFDYGGYGDMAGLAGMCSGVGQCRQKLTGVMCPSYMATLDETHTTRARANALRIALSDSGLLRGLADEALDEVMDLCLSCKACKSECPTGVDMAKLKAEWLAQRNDRVGVSREARFFASGPRLARWGALAPGLTNRLLAQPWLRGFLERTYGLDRRIAPPTFAPRTFRAIWDATLRQEANPRRETRGRVVYFADTWTNAYWPEVGVAAVRLLRAAGYDVTAPRLACCGRPLIGKGLLDEARETIRENVRLLAPEVERGAFFVGSEPSCLFTFLDEAPGLLPEARPLAQRVRTVEGLLLDTLRNEPERLRLRPVAQRLLLHGHCHQKALVGVGDSLALLAAIPGAEVAEINSGCCGMAGSFGHEKRHYEVARAIGKQRLFPAVRSRGEARIAVCGFSCREQLRHHTGVSARHVLDIVADAIDAPSTD